LAGAKDLAIVQYGRSTKVIFHEASPKNAKKERITLKNKEEKRADVIRANQASTDSRNLKSNNVLSQEYRLHCRLFENAIPAQAKPPRL